MLKNEQEIFCGLEDLRNKRRAKSERFANPENTVTGTFPLDNQLEVEDLEKELENKEMKLKVVSDQLLSI